VIFQYIFSHSHWSKTNHVLEHIVRNLTVEKVTRVTQTQTLSTQQNPLTVEPVVDISLMKHSTFYWFLCHCHRWNLCKYELQNKKKTLKFQRSTVYQNDNRTYQLMCLQCSILNQLINMNFYTWQRQRHWTSCDIDLLSCCTEERE